MKLNSSHAPKRSTKPLGVEYWHVWTVGIPRRSISGALVWGRVWRRHDGDRWQYASIELPMTPLPIQKSEINL
jgi:hypothetical protein